MLNMSVLKWLHWRKTKLKYTDVWFPEVDKMMRVTF